MATSGPPRAEKLIFSDKTLACSNDCAPKHIASFFFIKLAFRQQAQNSESFGAPAQRHQLVSVFPAAAPLQKLFWLDALLQLAPKIFARRTSQSKVVRNLGASTVDYLVMPPYTKLDFFGKVPK